MERVVIRLPSVAVFTRWIESRGFSYEWIRSNQVAPTWQSYGRDVPIDRTITACVTEGTNEGRNVLVIVHGTIAYKVKTFGTRAESWTFAGRIVDALVRYIEPRRERAYQRSLRRAGVA